MKPLFKRLRGMPDVVPDAIGPWHRLEAAVREVMRAYSYGEMRTPIVERTELFKRSIGEATDIVEKEMYTFADRKGENLTLRPENTASCVRAAIENGLLQQGGVNRIWYQGPMYRYERPQLGRQRQFYQTGAEVYGLGGPAIEAELILLTARLWRELGIDSAVQLEANTLGDQDDRARYREQLVKYFNTHKDELDEDSQRRLMRNPLRILDSKNPDMQELIYHAPAFRDSLSDTSIAHFDELQEILAASGISVIVNPRLVRGLDYYSHTVFEWTTERLGAQSAICAGGRYDGLLEEMGAPGVPGVGWASGMERLLLLMDALAVPIAASTPDVFVIATNDVPSVKALALAEAVRDALPGCGVLLNTAGGSMKSQFRKADKSGAQFALILGGEELANNSVTLKPLRGDGSGDGSGQHTLARSDMLPLLQQMLHI